MTGVTDELTNEIDTGQLAEALAELKHAERDWPNLNGEERHGVVHNAIHELEEALNVE
jgi:acyl-CoA reductase-like NAD-dependent aldehyde dehydrogenase